MIIDDKLEVTSNCEGKFDNAPQYNLAKLDKFFETYKKHFSEPYNNKHFLKHYREFLETAVELKHIEAYKNLEVDTLWNSWNLKQKLVWVWKVKLKFGLYEIQDYEDRKAEVLMECDTEEEWNAVEEVFKREYKFFWYEMRPKSVITVEYEFQPSLTASYVMLNIKVKDKPT